MHEKILVTGATGNVGSEVLRQLRARGANAVADLRSVPDCATSAQDTVVVDFENGVAPRDDYAAIFLLRPPQLANADMFRNFLSGYSRDTRIVFLSVQGADTKGYLPHAKIEKVIVEMGFPHVFVRPSYFMDNLTTTLWPELQENRRIFLPAGGLKFDWVSVRDVAALSVAALIGETPEGGLCAATGQLFDFGEVIEQINATLGVSLRYEPATLWGYVSYSRTKGTSWGLIMVMLLLHYLPRFAPTKKTPPPSALTEILGRAPESIEAFARRQSDALRQLR